MNRKDFFVSPFYYDMIKLDDDKVNDAIKRTPVLGEQDGFMSVDEHVLMHSFKFLFDPIDKVVCDVMLELGFKEYNIFTSWMTKTKTGARYVSDHMHCNSFYSGILYLTDKASPIMFKNPLPWRWISNEKAFDRYNSTNQCNQFIFTPRKEEIVLFPSHIYHLILPHDDPIERYSIAFNVVPCGQYGFRDSKINVSILKNL